MSHEATCIVSSEAEMDAFGAKLAHHLRAGDTLLLTGVIGAGKTHLCRSVIRSLMGKLEEVPSPTYTLVQTYEGDDVEVWHADLYRLSDSSELIELGLDEAMGAAIVLIEWPDRLPRELWPENALKITIEPEGETRRIRLVTRSEHLGKLLSSLSNA
jgi:tRNA threonylcarbamoyladenosine biosynthesis protein TsaE